MTSFLTLARISNQQDILSDLAKNADVVNLNNHVAIRSMCAKLVLAH